MLSDTYSVKYNVSTGLVDYTNAPGGATTGHSIDSDGFDGVRTYWGMEGIYEAYSSTSLSEKVAQINSHSSDLINTTTDVDAIYYAPDAISFFPQGTELTISGWFNIEDISG